MLRIFGKNYAIGRLIITSGNRFASRRKAFT